MSAYYLHSTMGGGGNCSQMSYPRDANLQKPKTVLWEGKKQYFDPQKSIL